MLPPGPLVGVLCDIKCPSTMGGKSSPLSVAQQRAAHGSLQQAGRVPPGLVERFVGAGPRAPGSPLCS